MPFAIRLATIADLGAIRDIYNYYVDRSTCTFQIEPDTEAERLAWFQGRTTAHPVVVSVRESEVVGWGALSPWKPRGGYARTVEASVYVRHDLHRRGIGKAILIDLIDRAKVLGHHSILGGTCSDQPGSLALQEAVGFERVGYLLEVGFKFGRWLDVVYMQLLLQ